ncbi:flavin reductase family protein [Planomonospora corallina]|uniref:Flavin reductase family protein n=1 Tax=Planomonospora corallina TaxID=1806052 RepID=A0ABV8HZ15_9ACTN
MTVDHSIPVRDVSDARSLRRAFSTFATGVTVVTTGTPPHAMTANSFTSVSLDPPLVLVCVDRGAVMHECLTMTRHFGVSVLASHQEAMARHFADRWRTLGAAQFDGVAWQPGGATGVPLMDEALAHFECELWRSYDGGDHTVFIGRVLSMDQWAGREPLLVFRGAFQKVRPTWDEVPG